MQLLTYNIPHNFITNGGYHIQDAICKHPTKFNYWCMVSLLRIIFQENAQWAEAVVAHNIEDTSNKVHDIILQKC